MSNGSLMLCVVCQQLKISLVALQMSANQSDSSISACALFLHLKLYHAIRCSGFSHGLTMLKTWLSVKGNKFLVTTKNFERAGMLDPYLEVATNPCFQIA